MIEFLDGFSDNTREWVVFSNGEASSEASFLVIYDTLAMKELRRYPLKIWCGEIHFVPGQSTFLYVDGTELRRITESSSTSESLSITNVENFAISSDGTQLVVHNQNAKTLQTFSYPELILQKTMTPTIPIDRGDLAFSADGSQIAIAGGYQANRVQVFSTSTGTSRSISIATQATGSYSPVFSKDGTKLYFGGGHSDGGIYVFNSASGTQIDRFQVSKHYQYSVSLIPGYDGLMTGGFDGALIFINSLTGTIDKSLYTGLINMATFSPSGKYVYVTTGAGRDRDPKVQVFKIN